MVSHVYQPALSELTSIKTNVLNNMEYLDNVTDQLKNPYLLYGQKGLQEEIDTFQSNLNKQLVTLETTLKNADLNDADEKKFNLFFKGIQEYFILQSQIFDHLSKQRELQALKQDRDKLYLEKFKWQQNMAALISLLSDKMTSKTYEAHIQTKETSQKLYYGLIFLCFFSLVLILYSYKTLKPIKLLTEKVKNLGHSAEEATIIKSNNEIGALARELNKISFSLKERDKKLLDQKEKLKNAYANIQQQNIHLQFLAEYKEKLIQSERLATIGRMSTHIAHEIKNPLNSIQLNIEYLREKSKKTPLYDDKVFPALLSQVFRLKKMTDSYLKFSKMPQSEKKMLEVNKILKELCNFYKDENVEINQIYEGASPLVQADALQLRQAFLNILKNASEAMPSGGKILIETKYDKNQKMIEVNFSDEGSGLKEEEKDKIFLPFYTTKAQGSGLGLSLTQQIIHEHGGDITWHSNQPRGSIFKVRLPQA